MKRILSTILAVGLLLGLGALAVLARGGGDILTPVRAAPVALAAAQPQTAAAPEAPAASSNYNMIALPLDVQVTWANITPTAIPFNSQGLAQYVGLSSVEQVLHWDPAIAGVRFLVDRLEHAKWGLWICGRRPCYGPWSLITGHVYNLLLNNTNSSLTLVSFVGDVPAANSIKFTLYGASACQYNQISVPLEQGALTTAAALATSMGGTANVGQVLRWDANAQAFDSWIPDDSMPNGGYGYVGGGLVTDPWSVNIGYPYVVCLSAGAQGDQWPN